MESPTADLSHQESDKNDVVGNQHDVEETLPVLTDSVKVEKTENSENIHTESETDDTALDIDKECTSNTVGEDVDRRLDGDSAKVNAGDKETNNDEKVKESDHSENNLCMDDKGADYRDVQVKVIEDPDEDDLFDFLRVKTEEKEEDLKKTELYKYLTEESQLHRQLEEVTPYPSGDEHDEEASGESSSSDEDNSSSGSSSSGDEEEEEEFESQEMLEGETLSERIAKEAQMEKEYKEMESQMKKKIEKKPSLKTPLSKTTSVRSQQGQLSKITMERLEKSKEVTKQWLKDLDIPENLKFSQPIEMKIADLNQYLTCGLCKGYLYEASTITECMHTYPEDTFSEYQNSTLQDEMCVADIYLVQIFQILPMTTDQSVCNPFPSVTIPIYCDNENVEAVQIAFEDSYKRQRGHHRSNQIPCQLEVKAPCSCRRTQNKIFMPPVIKGL